jgi:dolichol-phosphate mannosyltransferase
MIPQEIILSNLPTSDRPELTLIIPVYDEEHNIVPLIEEVRQNVSPSYIAIIIYDHDYDSTLNKVVELTGKHSNIRFVKNMYGTGVINAFKTGFALAETKYIVPVMADLSDMPETVNIMHGKIQQGYDLVVASRYIKNGAKIGGSRIKHFLSLLANKSLNFLTGIPTHDFTNAFIMYRKKVLDNIEISSTGGFEITMEIIAKAYVLDYNITEVPTINRDRTAGKSKFALWKWICKYLYWYFYIIIHSIRKRRRILINSGNFSKK